MAWLVCTMDEGIISEHSTKQRALNAVRDSTYGPLRARRIRAGDYEYECRCDSDHCPTFWVMTDDVARRHGFERYDA